MKYITFVIPSYNSAEYLHYALDSLICAGDDIEVLIINDGSKDDTLKIAKEYEIKYPNIFRAIDQDNLGHGGVINRGLKEAKGKYFKVLDSDDWVDEKKIKKLIEYIKNEENPDLFVTDYVYRNGRDKISMSINYKRFIKQDKLVTFKNVRRFILFENLTHHSTIFKTEVLRNSKVELPLHCLYEDNYYVYVPLPFIKNLVYLHIPFYQYLIGREGQSMGIEKIKGKYEDFIKCGKLIFNAYDLSEFKKDKGLYRIMVYHLILNASMVPMSCIMNGSKEALEALNKFEQEIKEANLNQYKIVIHSLKYKSFKMKSILGKGFINFFSWFLQNILHVFS